MTVSSLKGNPSPESVCRVLQKEQHWVQWVDRAHCSGEKGRTLLLFNPVALMVPPHFKIPLRHTSYDCLVEKTTDPFTRLKESISVTNSSLSGWYGAFSFEWGVARLLGQRRDSLTAPFWLGRYHNILIYDHTSHEWSVDSKEGSAPDDLQEILNQANNNKVPEILPQGFAPLEPRSGYSEKIESIQENIREGNVYQVNYTIPFQASLRADPLSMYCALRKRSPVPYGGYYDVGEILLCLSPELFLSSQGREVLSRPIKGTQPRKEATLHDKNEAQKLLDSEKNRAELLMIVDLIRNDLGKVCHPGTVAVPRHCVLESYSTVHHLASDVRGTLAAGFDAKDAFLALFPGGSITGAPKVAATRLIQQLESRPRGYYTGCLGYFGDDGSSEWNIAIRTLVVQEEQITCHSGGGIVIDSLKEEEYLELLSKIGYLLSPPSSERSAE